jgi:hypothetical protein
MAKSEVELCYYAEVTDHAGLEKAISFETHEQWEYKHPDGRGKVRIRRTENESGVSFEECLKIAQQSGQMLSNLEAPTPITEDYFKAWIALFGTAGVLKERYTFLSKQVRLEMNGKTVELPAVKFEVDVLKNQNGQRSKWCKIDIEIDHLLEILEAQGIEPNQVELSVVLSDLPFKPTSFISAVTTDEEERAGIQAFWRRFELKPEALTATET